MTNGSLAGSQFAGGFHNVARQGAIRLSGLAFDKLLGFVFALLVTKTYGPTVFGLYLFGVSVIEILLVLSKLGLDRSAVRAIASLSATGKFTEIKGVLRASIAITMPTGILIAGALFLFSDSLAQSLNRPRLAAFLSLAALAVPASVLADVFLWTTEGIGLQRYFVLTRTVCEPIIKVSLAALFFLIADSQPGVRALALAYIASIFTSATVSFIVYRRVVAAKAEGRPVHRHARELLRVGLPAGGQTIISRVLGQADIFLIFTFVSASATARYTVAMRTAMLASMLAFAFEAALRPIISSTLAKGEELKPLFRLVSRSILMLCLPASVVLILFPSRVMAAVGGQFVGVAPVVRLITIGALTYFALGPAGQALMMSGRTRVPFINGLIAGVVGVTLNLILIPRLGLVGAGIAQCSSAIVANALNAIAARRLLGIFSIGPRHARLLAAAAAASLVALLVDAVAPANRYIALAMIASATLATYASTLLMLGIANEDRQFIRSILMMSPKGADRSQKPESLPET